MKMCRTEQQQQGGEAETPSERDNRRGADAAGMDDSASEFNSPIDCFLQVTVKRAPNPANTLVCNLVSFLKR